LTLQIADWFELFWTVALNCLVRETRTVVAIALSAAYNAPVRGTMEWGVFRH